MEQGLAAQMGGMDQAGGNMQAMVNDVVQMLMQGMDPEVLLQQGVPMEVIQQAIEIILAQENQQANVQQPPQTESGLAMTMGM